MSVRCRPPTEADARQERTEPTEARTYARPPQALVDGSQGPVASQVQAKRPRRAFGEVPGERDRIVATPTANFGPS